MTFNGQCPECGDPIETSLAEWNFTKQVLTGAGAQWMRRIKWGAALLLSSWLIAIAGRFVSLAISYDLRPWALFIVCAGWALGHCGAWMLMVEVPRIVKTSSSLSWRNRRGIIGGLPLLSVFTPIWIYLPGAISQWSGWELGRWYKLLVIVGIVAGIVAGLLTTALSLLRIVQCVSLFRYRWTARLAGIIAVIYPIALGLTLFERIGDGTTSLDGLLSLPWIMHGFAWLMLEFVTQTFFDFQTPYTAVLFLAATAGQAIALFANFALLLVVFRVGRLKRNHVN